MPRSLRCPRCSTVVTVEEGGTPVCPSCGFGGPTAAIPASPPPAAAQPGFSMPPPPAGAGLSPPAATSFQVQPPHRPGAVTFVAVLGFINAGLLALAGLGLLVGGSAFGTLLAESGGTGDIAGTALAAVFGAIGAVLLLFAVLGFIVALGILRGHNWARITQVVLSILGILGSLAGLATGAFPVLLGLAFNIAIVAILFSRGAKAYFTPPASPSP